MISRVADHCFWVGRYLDRAESTSRLLQVTRALAFDAEMPTLECWRPVIIVSGQYPDFVARFDAEAAGNGEVVQRYMTWAPENPVSIRNAIRARARERALDPRGAEPRHLAGHQRALPVVRERGGAQQYSHDRDEVYKHVRRSTQLNLGPRAQHDAARHAHGLPVARRAARAHRPDGAHPRHAPLHARGARARSTRSSQTALWLSLLRSCSGFDAFMRVHRGRVSRQRGRRVPVLRDALPALAALLRAARRSRSCGASGPTSDSTDAAHAIEILAALDAWLGEQRARRCRRRSTTCSPTSSTRSRASAAPSSKTSSASRPPRRRSCKRSSRRQRHQQSDPLPIPSPVLGGGRADESHEIRRRRSLERVRRPSEIGGPGVGEALVTGGDASHLPGGEERNGETRSVTWRLQNRGVPRGWERASLASAARAGRSR